MPEVGNWIGEVTVAQGIGNLSLDGALPGYASFSVLGGDSTEVWYAIINGEDKEAGVGTLLGGLLQRTSVYATLVSGVYSDNDPDPINVQGDAEIYCTFNKTAFEEFANKVNPENAIFTGPAKFADGDVNNPSITFENAPGIGRYLNSIGQMVDAVDGQDVVVYLSNALRVLQQIQASNGDSSAPGISFDDDPNTGRYLNAIGDMRDTVDGTDVVKYLQNTVQFLVQQQNQAGTAGEPAYSFSDDPISGLYLAAQGEVRMAAQGIDQMRWIDNKVELWDNTNSKWVGVLNDDFSGYTESFTLANGQTEIVTSEDISGSAVFISGVDADNGRLLIDVDYTYDAGTKTITLADSRPAGTELYIQNVLEGDATVTIEKKFRVGRNLLINGDMQVWQRGDAPPAGGGLTYTADRWRATGITQASRNVTDLPVGAINWLNLNRDVAGTIRCEQRVESNSAFFLVGKITTFSFEHTYSGALDSIQLEIRVPDTADTWTTVTTVETIDITDISTGRKEVTLSALSADVSRGVSVSILYTTTGDADVKVTNAQLEIGQQATPYDYIPIGELVALCQRYYFKSPYNWIRLRSANPQGSTITHRTTMALPQRMRTSPTCSITSYQDNEQLGTVPKIYNAPEPQFVSKDTVGVYWVPLGTATYWGFSLGIEAEAEL